MNKLIIIAILVVLDSCGIALPLKLSTWFGRKHNLSTIICISGGFLLSTSLLQLLGEADKSAGENNHKWHISHLVSALGFIVTMISQNIMTIMRHRRMELKDHKEVYEMEETATSHLLDDEITGNSGGVKDARKHSMAHIFFVVSMIESLVSGFAIGVQTSESGLRVMAITIISHDWIEAVIFTVSFFPIETAVDRKRIIILGSVFCLATPMGILFGITLISSIRPSIAHAVSSTAVAFTSGVFLYLSIVEMIAKEFDESTLSFGIDDGTISLMEEEAKYADRSFLFPCLLFKGSYKARVITERLISVLIGFVLSTTVIYLLAFLT